jgi:hypothetical protein
MAPAVKGTARYNRKLKMNRERKFKKQLHKVRKNKIGKVLRRELLHKHATDNECLKMKRNEYYRQVGAARAEAKAKTNR